MSVNVGPETLTPRQLLENEPSPLVLTATLRPVGGLDRFQPAGFPEVGHVIYKAPRDGGAEENVCIVDSPASMANHLEAVCMRGPHDYELVDELKGMPYVRCVTGSLDGNGTLSDRQVVLTSLTEGHRIASTYFLEGVVDMKKAREARSLRDSAREFSGDEKRKKEKENEARKLEEDSKLQARLIDEFGIALAGSKQAHPPADRWWDVFKTIFKYDPNSLVHGVLFPQWQIKIPRMLTAHLEAIGAGRVDRSGVKFDRLGKTTSGQPIFAVDDATAREIRATFILDLSLVGSFGRTNGETTLGLTEDQKEFLVALALWKIRRLLDSPFRFRSGCHLESDGIRRDGHEVSIDVDIRKAIENARFETEPRVTDVWWPREELYREPAEAEPSAEDGESDSDEEAEE